MDNYISRIPRPIVDESALPNVSAIPQPNVVYANAPNIIETLQNLDVPESQTAPVTIQTTSTPITASNPLNGVLVTLATLGVITASAGALTMTSTALAKKREQDEAKATQMATLQAQQSAQAQSAGANWEHNQTMQANAKQSVMTEVTQSDANRQFWADYAIWEQKVAEAEAKRQAQQQTATTGGMFPAGSTVEDLPPHLQKLFWELGNMHFEKDGNGDWRFADDRGELGYFQYLIREALREGDSEKLTQHFQDANKYIDKTLLNWSDSELETVRDSAVSLVTQKQNNIPNGNASDKRISLMVETNKGVVDVNYAIQQKSLEIKQDFVERERQHLNTFVDTQVNEHQTIAHQTITTNMSQVAVRIQPLVTTGVSSGGGGFVPLQINTGVLSNIINTIPLTLSAEDLPVPPPPGTGDLIVMAGTSEAEIDAIQATQYTHYLDTNYDVELTTNGDVDWSATETYDVFLATENTAQALYYQAIQSGLLDLGMSRFDLSTLSPEQVFKNAIGHIEIQKTGSGGLTNLWRPDTDDSLITFSSIPEGESFQWLLTGEIGRILDNRSFNYGTSELQRNGIPHQNEIVSGFSGGNWNRSDAGMVDISYVGGPSVRGVQTDNPASDEWADMFAHWVNFTNFRMTQPYDLSEAEIKDRFITDYLGYQIVPLREDVNNLSPEEAARIYMDLLNSRPYLSSHDGATPTGVSPSEYQNWDSSWVIEEAMFEASNRNHWQVATSVSNPYAPENPAIGLYPSLSYMLPQYIQVGQHFDTYFDRMSRMDNWVSGSLFTANLWREPNFQENLMDEIRAVDNHWGMYNAPIFNNTYTGEIHDFNTIHQLSYIHPGLAGSVQTYQTHIDNLEILSPTGLKDLYQSQRDLLFRMLHSAMGSRTVGTHGETPLTQAPLRNEQVDVSTEALGEQTPYALHLLTNAQLVSLAQTATLAAVNSHGGFLNPTLIQLESLFDDVFKRPENGTYRDTIGMPIAGTPIAQATVERPWLLDAMLFGAGMVSDVADLAIMGVEGLGYAIEGDWDAVLLILALGALPLVPATATRAMQTLEPFIREVSEMGQQFIQDANRLLGRLDNNINNEWGNFGNLVPATPNGANPNQSIKDFMARFSNNTGNTGGNGSNLIQLAKSNKPPHVSQADWDAVVNHYANDTAMLERLSRDANLGLVPSNRYTSNYIITHLNTLNTGHILESNARQQALQEGLTFVTVPGTSYVTSNETGLRSLLGLNASDKTVDMLLQNPTTGNFILAEVKSTDIVDAENQLRATVNSMQNTFPQQNLELRIYTSSSNYSRLQTESGRAGRRIEADGTLIDINTDQPVTINNITIRVIETTG